MKVPLNISDRRFYINELSCKSKILNKCFQHDTTKMIKMITLKAVQFIGIKFRSIRSAEIFIQSLAFQVRFKIRW